MKKKIIIGIIIVLIIISIALVLMFKKEKELVIRDIVYDNNSGYISEIYLKEKDEYVPYLVLTNDYNDNTLLLRKNILNTYFEFVKKEKGEKVLAYYGTSYIDQYLNNDFLDNFSSEMKDKILNAKISITKKGSIGTSGLETETIERKVFILSYTEVGGEDSSTMVTEGIPLKYFQKESRVSETSLKEVNSWWLRTPNTWYENIAGMVSIDGSLGINSVGGDLTGYCGLRPAFTISSDTLLIKKDDIIKGKEVFALE